MTSTTPLRARLVSVLAVLAVLCVLGATAATVAAYSRRGGDAATGTGTGQRSTVGPSTAAPGGGGQGFAGGRFVVAGGARFEVPPERAGWSVQDRGTVLYYLGRDGRPAVGVSGAAVFRAGYCSPGDDSNRAFAGFTHPTTGSRVRAATLALARDWVDAISLDEDRVVADPHTRPRIRRVTLDDGTAAIRATSRITVADPGPCDARAVEVAVLGFRLRAAVAHLVLVRDAGAPGALGDHAAERILGTARRIGR